MAVNTTRRLNGDLDEGATDGKYKKTLKTDRGGVVEPTMLADRRQLPPYYEVVEAPVKVRPDGKIVR